MKPTYLRLDQSGDDWKRWRAKGIGSSAAPIIMLENPYQTPYDLWKEYVGLAEKPPENRFMLRGKRLEPEAREAYTKETGNKVFPGCYEHPAFTHLRCSTDGGFPVVAPELVAEIKCPTKNTTHLSAKEGQVPRIYYGQCQHLLMVTGAKHLDFVSYWGETGEVAIVPVEPDEEYTDRMMAAEHKFWKMVQDGQFYAPDGVRDMSADPEWQRLSGRFKEIDDLCKHYEQLKKTCASELASLAGNETARAWGNGIEAIWTHTVKKAESKPRGPVDSWALKVQPIPAKRED